ncbi:MAG: hypothetical protein ABSH16_00125 [Sedimentisphaerales bacterium]
MSKKVFDFTEMMVPGTEFDSTDTLNGISATIRGLEEAKRKGIIAGIEAVFSPNIPSHTFLGRGTTAGGNIICSEMTWPYDPVTANNGNNNFCLTEEYSLNAFGNHLVALARCPAFDDDDIGEDLQAKSIQWQIDCHRRGMQYGIENLLAYLGIGKVNNSQEVCVQYKLAHRLWLLSIGVKFDFPSSWKIDGDKPNVVDLEEVVEWNGKNGWSLPFAKEVDDNYDQTTALEASLRQETDPCGK